MCGGDLWGWLRGEVEAQSREQQPQLGLGLGVTREHDLTAIGNRDLDVEHLHTGELVEHAARRQARRVRSQLLGQRGMQAVGEERDKDVRFDALLVLMVDRADRQIALEVLEGFLNLDELEVVAPQLGGIVAGEIGAQQVAPFAAPDLVELAAIQALGEGRALLRHAHLDQPPARWIPAARGAQLHQQLLVRERHG